MIDTWKKRGFEMDLNEQTPSWAVALWSHYEKQRREIARRLPAYFKLAKEEPDTVVNVALWELDTIDGDNNHSPATVWLGIGYRDGRWAVFYPSWQVCVAFGELADAETEIIDALTTATADQGIDWYNEDEMRNER